MKKYSIYGVLFLSVIFSCYDSDDKITISNTVPTATELVVSGDLKVSATLTASYTFTDTDGDTENGSTYQWYTAEDTSGTNKEAISGATNSTYVVTTDDVDQYIGFEVTPNDGTEAGEAQLSSFVGPITQEEINNTVPTATELVVSGDLKVSATLTASYTFTDADGDTESGSTYQWYTAEDTSGTNKQAITGATNSTYGVTMDDVDQYIGFEVTPNDGTEAGEAQLSSFVGPIIQDNTYLTGEYLVLYLREAYAPPTLANDQYDYDSARDLMYSEIWIQNTNQLTGIYSGYQITMDLTQDPSTNAYNNDINTEHIYPQSAGAGEEPMRSDMHHLAPSKVNVNTDRGNLPFMNISDSQANKWYQNATTYSSDPDGSSGESEAYSKSNNSYFEPRDEVKGDIARAVMYFYTMYDSADATFFESMKSTLLEWHELDPVDDFERSRNDLIKTYQGNDNPYIVDETYAAKAFGN